MQTPQTRALLSSQIAYFDSTESVGEGMGINFPTVLQGCLFLSLIENEMQLSINNAFIILVRLKIIW